MIYWLIHCNFACAQTILYARHDMAVVENPIALKTFNHFLIKTLNKILLRTDLVVHEYDHGRVHAGLLQVQVQIPQ